MTVATYRTALAAALEGMTDMRATAYMTLKCEPPPGGGFAMFDLEPSYDVSFARGADEYSLRITVFAQAADERPSQVFLDAIRDGSSATGLKQVVEGDSGVAAVCDYTRIVSASAIDLRTIGHADYLAVDFTGEVVF